MNQKKHFLGLISIFSIIINFLHASPTPMERDNIVTNADQIPDRGSMHIILVAKDNKDETVVHELRVRMMADDINNVLNYKANQSIIKKMPIFMKKSGQQIVSDKIFQVAVNDSIKKDFNTLFWEFNSKTPDYTIILPAPYIKDLQWHKPSNINNATFQSLWKKAQKSINYYLSAYTNNTWPLRSYSDALAKWGSQP